MERTLIVIAALLLAGCAIVYEKAGTNDENSACVILCFSSGSDMIGEPDNSPTPAERDE